MLRHCFAHTHRTRLARWVAYQTTILLHFVFYTPFKCPVTHNNNHKSHTSSFPTRSPAEHKSNFREAAISNRRLLFFIVVARPPICAADDDAIGTEMLCWLLALRN